MLIYDTLIKTDVIKRGAEISEINFLFYLLQTLSASTMKSLGLNLHDKVIVGGKVS